MALIPSKVSKTPIRRGPDGTLSKFCQGLVDSTENQAANAIESW